MENNYTLLRHDLIRDNKLNSRATILLAVLVSYYNKDLGHAYPSYEVLLKNTGINKRTLIKELKFLEDNGYKCVKVQPVDMFVNSSHVECVVLLSKVQK